MRIVLMSKSSNRVLREFTGDFHYQVFLALEHFLDGLVVAPDFVDFREYRLIVYKK